LNTDSQQNLFDNYKALSEKMSVLGRSKQPSLKTTMEMEI